MSNTQLLINQLRYYTIIAEKEVGREMLLLLLYVCLGRLINSSHMHELKIPRLNHWYITIDLHSHIVHTRTHTPCHPVTAHLQDR